MIALCRTTAVHDRALAEQGVDPAQRKPKAEPHSNEQLLAAYSDPLIQQQYQQYQQQQQHTQPQYNDQQQQQQQQQDYTPGSYQQAPPSPHTFQQPLVVSAGWSQLSDRENAALAR